MGRAKITLKCIQNERTRKVAFMQRRKGLMKKVSDFSTMCKVEASLIVYDGNGNGEPMTWPQDPTLVHSILRKYEHQKNELPVKAFDLKDYFENKKNIVEAETSKVQKEIINIKYPTWSPYFSNMGVEQLRAFIATLDAKIGACNHRINMLKNKQPSEASSNFMENMDHLQSMAHESDTSSHTSQLNFMQNISRSQHIHAPVKSVTDTCGMVDFINQVDNVPLDSTNQLGEAVEWADPLGEPVDWANQFVELEYWANLLADVEWASQPDEFILQNIPFQSQNEQQGATLHALPPPKDGF